MRQFQNKGGNIKYAFVHVYSVQVTEQKKHVRLVAALADLHDGVIKQKKFEAALVLVHCSFTHERERESLLVRERER